VIEKAEDADGAPPQCRTLGRPVPISIGRSLKPFRTSTVSQMRTSRYLGLPADLVTAMTYWHDKVRCWLLPANDRSSTGSDQMGARETRPCRRVRHDHHLRERNQAG
jgi:hypothetical protein